MTDETKTETISEVQKSDSQSLEGLVATILKNQEARIDKFEKKFDDLAALIKEHNANPVDTGIEAENKPKVEDANDVGDKVTAENKVAPKPSESQASIAQSDNTDSGSDKSGLKMENKAEEEKEEEKEESKEEDVKKSESDSEYEFVKSVRPQIRSVEKKYPTGYQILKNIVNGWNGKTTSADQSLLIAYQKLEAGEFGNGFAVGGY